MHALGHAARRLAIHGDAAWALIKLAERAGVSPHGQAARAATRGTVHEEVLIGILEVVACHMITDAADFIAQVVVQDLKAYERLLTENLLCPRYDRGHSL